MFSSIVFSTNWGKITHGMAICQKMRQNRKKSIFIADLASAHQV
jgi:hypothetical protein